MKGMNMDAIFEREYAIRLSDFDSRMNLSAASILNLFQDVAANHAETMGVGFKAMLDKNLAWILTRVKFQVMGSARMFERCKVKTWPLEPTRRNYQREYLIENDAGETLVRGTAEWTVINIESRRLVAMDEVYPKEFKSFHDVKTFGDTPTVKVERFESMGEPFLTVPGASSLDLNQHVNNARYAEFVTDVLKLPDNEHIDTFQIDYHREVLLGDELRIYTSRSGDEILVKGENSADKLMFLCRVNLKNRK